MKALAGGLAVLLLVGCATASGPRSVAFWPKGAENLTNDYPLPTPSWPLRTGNPGPLVIPNTSVPPVIPVSVMLPLPESMPLPVKKTPVSRSWTPVAEEKVAELPVPVAPTVTATQGGPSPTGVAPSKPATKPTVAKADKAPATVPAVPQPAKVVTAVAPPTAAATASLLPTDPSPSADFQWQDVNAVAGDAVTLHFDKTNWLYLDTPAQQKTLGFQSINRDKDSTTFQFRPLVPGQYTLEFQRQDVVNQTNETRRVRVTVAPVGTRTTSTGTALAPQTSSIPPNNTLEASRILSAGGKTAEAIQKLLDGYKVDDSRTNLELARLLDQTGQDREALSYLDKNLSHPGPEFQGTLELGIRLAATQDPVNRLPTYTKLWMAGTTAPPEDLYIQAMDALRAQKQTTQAKDWSAKYTSWFPEPRLRDQYLFELGQLLEEPGTTRDIKGAWKAYKEIVEMYPLSPIWKAAGERAAYLNRHFLQVR